MKILYRWLWVIPAGLGLGALLALLDGGTWWIGTLAYGSLSCLGLLALCALWRRADAPPVLMLVLLLAFFLRLGLGVAFSYILPEYGYDNEMQNAGYIFRDSYQRDNQAWELAASETPLLQAFDKSHITDQYGGLLFVSGLLYRCLSPDLHRPWLVILLAALSASIGVGLAYFAARAAWGRKIALLTTWVLALYPEAILQGSAQMREPFLMTFIAMLFGGAMVWKASRWQAFAWLAGGMLGLLLFSPGVAAVAVVMLAVWIWLSARQLRLRWWLVAGVAALVVLSLFLLAGAVGGSLQIRGGPLADLFNWLRYSMKWDAHLMEQNSGWIQKVFETLPAPLQFPFIVAYGIAQPVLPAAIADATVWPMQALGILRGLGWYALLPFLIYSLVSIMKMEKKPERLAWLWLWLAGWAWVLISSARAGGDQWDNPRYRVIFLLFQAALAAQAFFWQRSVRDRWLGRLLAVEGVFLALFGYWYAVRYIGWQAGQVHIFVIIGLIVALSLVILLGGGLLDRRRKPRL